MSETITIPLWMFRLMLLLIVAAQILWYLDWRQR